MGLWFVNTLISEMGTREGGELGNMVGEMVGLRGRGVLFASKAGWSALTVWFCEGFFCLLRGNLPALLPFDDNFADECTQLRLISLSPTRQPPFWGVAITFTGIKEESMSSVWLILLVSARICPNFGRKQKKLR